MPSKSYICLGSVDAVIAAVSVSDAENILIAPCVLAQVQPKSLHDGARVTKKKKRIVDTCIAIGPMTLGPAGQHGRRAHIARRQGSPSFESAPPPLSPGGPSVP